MDAHLVSQEVASATAEANITPSTAVKASLSNEDIRTLTDMARTTSAARAARTWNAKAENKEKQVNERTVQRYKKHWCDNRQYLVTQKRGQKTLLLPAERETLSKAFDTIRSSGQAVTAYLFSRVARGIVTRARPTLTAQDRVALFSTSWARDEMGRMGLRVRRGTTDRTVTAGRIAADGRVFYDQLAATGVQHKSLLFNMDEFFCKMDNAGRSWTWERVRKGEKKNIAIKSEKLGFTCSVLSSAAGDAHYLQMIWKGKTGMFSYFVCSFTTQLLSQMPCTPYLPKASQKTQILCKCIMRAPTSKLHPHFLCGWSVSRSWCRK